MRCLFRPEKCVQFLLLFPQKTPTREAETKKLYDFSKLPLLDNKIDRKTNFAKLSFKN